jgi:hypothetical protein
MVQATEMRKLTQHAMALHGSSQRSILVQGQVRPRPKPVVVVGIFTQQFAQMAHDFIAAREGPLAAERVVDSIASEFFHAPNTGEKIPDDYWRPRKGFRGTIRRSRSRMSLMPAVDIASLGHRLKDLPNRLGISRNFTVETCGDRMFYIHAGAPPRQMPIPPTIVAFVHRLAEK